MSKAKLTCSQSFQMKRMWIVLFDYSLSKKHIAEKRANRTDNWRMSVCSWKHLLHSYLYMRHGGMHQILWTMELVLSLCLSSSLLRLDIFISYHSNPSPVFAYFCQRVFVGNECWNVLKHMTHQPFKHASNIRRSLVCVCACTSELKFGMMNSNK